MPLMDSRIKKYYDIAKIKLYPICRSLTGNGTRETLKIIKDSKWQLVNKKQELLDLIDNKCYLLKEKYYSILEKNKFNITEEQLLKIEEFINKYHEDDKKLMLDLIECTELMLLNNS